MPRVIIVSPKAGEIIKTSNPTLKWFTDYNYPMKFDLIISTDKDFRNIVIRENDLEDIEYTIKDDLKLGTQYFWRVRGRSLTQSGEIKTSWSGISIKKDDKTIVNPFFFTVSSSAISESGIDDKFLDKLARLLEKSEPGKKYKPSKTIAKLTQITFNKNNDYQVNVSPSGIIAFTSDRNGNPDVFIKRKGKVGVTQKTFSESLENNPFWIDDSTLVFNSNRLDKSKFHLFYVKTEERSKRKTQVTITPSEYVITGYCFPDKKTLIYSQKSPYEDSSYLWLLDTETRSFTQTIPGFSPAVSKEGIIAYVSDKAGQSDIWMMDDDMTDETQITTDPSHDFDPAWSPDGKWLAFVSNRSGNSDIWLMRANGTNLAQLTTHPLVDRRPFFSPDSKYIYFESKRNGNKDIWKMEFKDTKSGI